MSAQQTATGQQLAGGWNELKGRVRERWGELTDTDLDQAQGEMEKLVGVIQRKTGETRDQIERFLESSASEASQRMEQLRSSVSEYSHHAAEGLREGYARAESLVQRSPSSAVALAFGIGIAAGLCLTMCLRAVSRD